MGTNTRRPVRVLLTKDSRVQESPQRTNSVFCGPHRPLDIFPRYRCNKNPVPGFRRKQNIRRLFDWEEKISFWLGIKHVCGPKKIPVERNEAIVFCHVQNGELYVKSFIKHYFSLGAKHIIFLDNDSHDNTIAIAREYNNVTIFSTKALMKRREILFENYLIKKLCKGGWCINVDIDELLDYPFSDSIHLKQLLDYLNSNSYTAVVGQMLDMFSDKPLNEKLISNDTLVSDAYRYYDIAHIKKYGYATFKEVDNTGNILANQDIKFYFCGIRKYIFNTNNGLTKHPMIFVHDKLVITHPHCVRNAHCADISVVLFHYPFVNIFEKSMRYIKKDYGPVSEYKAYLAKYMENPGMIIKQNTSKKLYATNELVMNRFLVVSKKYLKFIRSV